MYWVNAAKDWLLWWALANAVMYTRVPQKTASLFTL